MEGSTSEQNFSISSQSTRWHVYFLAWHPQPFITGSNNLVWFPSLPTQGWLSSYSPPHHTHKQFLVQPQTEGPLLLLCCCTCCFHYSLRAYIPFEKVSALKIPTQSWRLYANVLSFVKTRKTIQQKICSFQCVLTTFSVISTINPLPLFCNKPFNCFIPTDFRLQNNLSLIHFSIPSISHCL